MNSLPEFEMSHDVFIDKTTMVFGESGTGKSFIIGDILYNLHKHIDQIVVFSPTDRQNHTYDRGLVPPPLIHYEVDVNVLEEIWERQTALASIYSRANDPKVINSLFIKCASEKELTMLQNARASFDKYKEKIINENPEIANEKLKDMEKDYEKFKTLTCKKCIEKNSNILKNKKLNEKESFTLKYVNFNPRIVIIFDDCTEMLNKIKNSKVVQRIFYQGRWAFITAIFAAHTDKAFSPEVKKNSYVNIFTSKKSAASYFNRGSNDFDKNEKQTSNRATNIAFTQLAKYQKLIWIRDGLSSNGRQNGPFYKYTAQKHDNFRFGSDAIWNYANLAKAKDNYIGASNKYLAGFY